MFALSSSRQPRERVSWTRRRRLDHDRRGEYPSFIHEPTQRSILPHDPRSRRLFVTSGGLKKVQEIQSEPNSILAEYIKTINCCFPEEIVRYYSPGYPDSLLERVEQYQPKYPSDTGLGRRLSSEPSDSSVSLLQGEDG